MRKTTEPVTLEGIEFDALLSISETLDATVPQYPVETGFCVSDSVILSPESLDLTLFVSERPVTWKERFGDTEGRVIQVVEMLKELYFAKELVTLTTCDKVYTDMAIVNFAISESNTMAYAMEIPLKLVKVRTTTWETTTIPDSYGKSGTTQTATGTASTSVAYTSTSGSSSGSSSSSSSSSSNSSSSSSSSSSSNSSSSSSSSSSKSGSILYNLASSAGLF